MPDTSEPRFLDGTNHDSGRRQLRCGRQSRQWVLCEHSQALDQERRTRRGGGQDLLYRPPVPPSPEGDFGADDEPELVSERQESLALRQDGLAPPRQKKKSLRRKGGVVHNIEDIINPLILISLIESTFGMRHNAEVTDPKRSVGRPRVVPEARKSLLLRIPSELFAEMRAYAELRGKQRDGEPEKISVNSMIWTALKEWTENQTQESRDAAARLRRKFLGPAGTREKRRR